MQNLCGVNQPSRTMCHTRMPSRWVSCRRTVQIHVQSLHRCTILTDNLQFLGTRSWHYSDASAQCWRQINLSIDVVWCWFLGRKECHHWYGVWPDCWISSWNTTGRHLLEPINWSPQHSTMSCVCDTDAACVLRLGCVTARHSTSGRQPNFVALNRGRHPYSAELPSRWALAHISSSY